MRSFHVDYEWIARLMPEGIPVPSSILISGPGGSGKPLIGLAIVASWLRQGGKVVFIPMQYPDRSFTEDDLKRLYGVDLADYKGDVFFIKFDAELEPAPDAVEHISPDEVRVNLVNPAVWDRAMELAAQALGQSQLGTLVFGSALNLLLFSRTYGEQMFAKLESLLRGEKRDTYLFTVSSNALQEKIRALEKAADHLLLAESAKSPRGGPELHLRVARLRGASHSDEVAVAPFDPATLEEMRRAAEASRVRRIPAIRNI